MIDAHAIVLAYLENQAAIVAKFGARIHAGRDRPPVGYKPSNGACLVFKVRGGGPDYEDALLKPSLQVKCYDESELAAEQAYLVLYEGLHNAHGADVLHAEVEVLGQPGEEPETGWFFNLSFWKVMLRQS